MAEILSWMQKQQQCHSPEW